MNKKENPTLTDYVDQVIKTHDRNIKESALAVSIKYWLGVVSIQLPNLGTGTMKSICGYASEECGAHTNPFSIWDEDPGLPPSLNLHFSEIQKSGRDLLEIEVRYTPDGSDWFFCGPGGEECIELYCRELVDSDFIEIANKLLDSILILSAVFPEAGGAICKEAEDIRSSGLR